MITIFRVINKLIQYLNDLHWVPDHCGFVLSPVNTKKVKLNCCKLIKSLNVITAKAIHAEGQ